MQEDVLFCGSFSAQPSLVKRLADEFKEATREFRENPKQYITSAIRGDGLDSHRRKSLLRLGLAIAIVLYAIFFAAVLVLWAFSARYTAVAKKNFGITVINAPYCKLQKAAKGKAKGRALAQAKMAVRTAVNLNPAAADSALTPRTSWTQSRWH